MVFSTSDLVVGFVPPAVGSVISEDCIELDGGVDVPGVLSGVPEGLELPAGELELRLSSVEPDELAFVVDAPLLTTVGVDPEFTVVETFG